MNDNLKDPFKTILNNILYANGFEVDEENQSKKDLVKPDNEKPNTKKQEKTQEDNQK